MPDRQIVNQNGANSISDIRAIRGAGYVTRSIASVKVQHPVEAEDKAELQNKSDSRVISSGISSVVADVSKPIRSTVQRTQSTRPALPRQRSSVVLHRSSFGAKMARKSSRKRTKHPKSRSLYTLRAMAVVVLLCGVGVGVNAWHINRISNSQAAVLSKATGNAETDNQPSEQVPAQANSSYRVASDLPRILTIPKIQVNARVQRLGVQADNDLAAPSNIFDVGWYEGSSKPGEKGVVVINGYVSGPTKHGVFYSLANLHEQDEILLERGDGNTFRYRIVKQQTYEYDELDMPTVLSPIESGKAGLNLVTAGGRFDVRTNKFEKKMVIFAVLAE